MYKKLACLVILFFALCVFCSPTYAVTSESQAKSLITKGTEVTKGNIRLCVQASKDTCYISSFWKSASAAGTQCTRGAFSMAMSYLGIDCTPLHMQEIASVNWESGSGAYSNVLKSLNKENDSNITLSTRVWGQWNLSALNAAIDRFTSDSTYSPILIWGHYNNSDENFHAMVLVGKAAESNGIARYIIIDPSSNSHSNGHVGWMDVDTKSGKSTARSSSLSHYSSYRIERVLQWHDENASPAIGDFDLVAEIQAVVTTREDKDIVEYNLQDEPYAAANTLDKVAPGTDLTTTGVYKNKHGNYWLRFTDGTYLCANDVKLKTPVTAPETSGLVYPKGNLTFGKSFDLKGTIKSKSTMPEVWAAVYKLDGDKVDNSFPAVTAYLKDVKTVDIYTSALNKSSLGGISFSKLAKGDYYFTLWAYYYTYQDVEKTSENPLRKKQAVFLADEPFTVGGGDSGTNEDISEGKYQTAPDRIAYYHQYMKTDGKTTWNYHTNNTYWDEQLNSIYGLAISDGDGDSPNISGRGCCLLAYGHAIQWLDGKADATRQIEILAELVRKSTNPPTAEEIYGEYVASEYGATFKSVGTNWTEDILRNIFDRDGAIIVCNKYSSGNNSGHVALAIGYRVHNGTFYVQMMDSTCRATLKRLPDGGASAKVYDFSAAANLTYSAGQYWVPLKQFSGIIKWSYSLIPNDAAIGDDSGTTEEVNDAVDLCTLNAKFTYNKDANAHALPYAASTKKGAVTAGQTVVVTKLVQNRYNNIWAQLSDGSYLCFYDQSKDERYMTFISTNALEVSNDAKMPTGDIPLATSFGLRGTITADMPIYSVTAKVTNRETEAVTVGPVTATSAKGAFTKSVTMNKALNGVNINDKMSFKKLTTAGYYSYEVLVQLGFTYAYNGEVFKFGAEQVVICSDFTAGSPDEEIILPDVPDDPMPEPIPVERIDVTMDGTYGFYGDPCEFSWEVYPNDATDKSVTWTSSNEDVIKLQMTEQGTMKLCYVNCGMTEITVKANDGSGISKSYQVTVVPKLHYSWNLGNEVVVGKTIAGYLELSVEPSTANINIVGEDKNILDIKFQETSPGEYDIEVHGINPGNTLVLAQASSNGYLNSCWTDITVRQPVYVESIDIYGLPTEMKVGETADMYFVFNPEDHDCTSWGVLSGNPSMIEVQQAYWDEYGNYVYPVIACAPGTVTITVEADDGSEAVATHTITIKGSVLSGDANEDGLVNIYDVLLVLQYSAGWNVTLTTDNADVNNDGVIGPSDAVQILRYCAGGDLVSALRALKDLLGDIDINMLEIVKQPVDQHVSIDQTAQFAVTVTGESVTYQWYINRNDGKDWCKLNGASGSAYVTSAVEADNDGFQYRCVITDVYGNELTSDIAVLHVVPELPVTGDASTPVLWLMLCVLSALGILFMSRRRVFR